MSFKQNSQVWSPSAQRNLVLEIIRQTLQDAHAKDSSVIKFAGKKTGVSYHTINKWYQGKNVPKSTHLLILLKSYPPMLHCLIEALNLDIQYESDEASFIGSTSNHPCRSNKDSDKIVVIDINIGVEVATQLNLRQLWFVSELHKTKRLSTNSIVQHWSVSKRTAQRDVRYLVKLELVCNLGNLKEGYYCLV